ncbi:MAG: 4Fe-4S binding protein, partial [Muribaculaceae bacterium]|nr:4Fe-4S binding protein [Muribaculaceae bacterium]
RWIYQWLDPYDDFTRIIATLAHLGEASLSGLAISLVLLAIVASAALWRGRIICNTICPVGTALGTVSRYAIMHIDIDTDLCINCRRCADVCKAQCIDLDDHVVDSSRCVNCFNCLPVCPNDAIHYTTQRKQLSIPMMQSLSTGAASAMTTPCGCVKSKMNNNRKISCK